MSFLPALAEHIAKSFPELNGRAVAVSEVEVKKDAVPTLPVCMLALEHESGGGKQITNQLSLTETFIIDFWLKPKTIDAYGQSIAFYAFYDYETIRNRLIEALNKFEYEGIGTLYYVKLEPDVTSFAARLKFTFERQALWCRPPVTPEETEALAGRRIIFEGITPKV